MELIKLLTDLINLPRSASSFWSGRCCPAESLSVCWKRNTRNIKSSPSLSSDDSADIWVCTVRRSEQLTCVPAWVSVFLHHSWTDICSREEERCKYGAYVIVGSVFLFVFNMQKRETTERPVYSSHGRLLSSDSASFLELFPKLKCCFQGYLWLGILRNWWRFSPQAVFQWSAPGNTQCCRSNLTQTKEQSRYLSFSSNKVSLSP